MDSLALQVNEYREETFKAGDAVLRQGHRGGTVYVLKSGAVTVNVGDREVAKLDAAGTIFGEIAVMLECEHTATVVCTEESTFHVIDDFVDYLKRNPDDVAKISQLLQKRLMTTGTKVIDTLPLDMQLAGCTEITFNVGDSLTTEGKAADRMFILKRGRVRLEASGSPVSEVHDSGSMFGELALLTGGTYSATITAVQPTVVFAISDLAEFCAANPAASLQMMKYLADRLTSVIAQFMELKSEVMKSHTKKAPTDVMQALTRFDQLLTSDIMNPFYRRKVKIPVLEGGTD